MKSSKKQQLVFLGTIQITEKVSTYQFWCMHHHLLPLKYLISQFKHLMCRYKWSIAYMTI